MTSNHDDNLEDKIFSEILEKINAEDTLIEEQEKIIAKACEQMYLAKIRFAESVEHGIEMIGDYLGADEEFFKRVTNTTADDLPSDEYTFTINDPVSLSCEDKNGVYKQLNCIGGIESFLPHGVFVNAVTDEILFRLRPIYVTSAQYVDIHLMLDKDRTYGNNYERLCRQFLEYVREVFSADFKELETNLINYRDQMEKDFDLLENKSKYSVEAW